jgi:hypothetical protein
MSKPTPQKYKTTNWKDYNRVLRARGSLTVWLDTQMQWQAPASGKPGRPAVYSDAAVQCCLTMKVLFGLALRQTQGFVHSVLKLSGLDWQAGDAPMLPELLGQIPAEETVLSVSGDGAYDPQDCHDAIALRGAQAVIPTRKNAKPWEAKRPRAGARNDILRAINRLGREIWKQWSGYHRCSLVQTKMRRFKLLGERVMARTF